MSHKSIEHSKESIISITQHNSLMKAQNRCIEDRIESAKKLVRKLNRFCPYYEVTVNGEDAGRVFCKICQRHLGAVSSTLKNHVNTQEHKQAVDESQGPNGMSHGSALKSNCVEMGRSVVPNSTSRQSMNNGITGQNSSNNSAFDFESFDIQWVPSFPSINNMDYCMADNQIGSNHISAGEMQSRTITSL